MTDHEEPIDDTEARRIAALHRFEADLGKYAHKYEGPDPAGERSEAIRRLLTADDPYEGLTGALLRPRVHRLWSLAALPRRITRQLRSRHP